MTKAELIEALKGYDDGMIIKGYVFDGAHGDRACDIYKLSVYPGELHVTLWQNAILEDSDWPVGSDD